MRGVSVKLVGSGVLSSALDLNRSWRSGFAIKSTQNAKASELPDEMSAVADSLVNCWLTIKTPPNDFLISGPTRP